MTTGDRGRGAVSVKRGVGASGHRSGFRFFSPFPRFPVSPFPRFPVSPFPRFSDAQMVSGRPNDTLLLSPLSKYAIFNANPESDRVANDRLCILVSFVIPF